MVAQFGKLEELIYGMVLPYAIVADRKNRGSFDHAIQMAADF